MDEGPRRVGPEGWGPKGGAPKGGPRRVGGQNFALFSLSHHNFLSFLPFFVGLLVEFWWCLKRRDPLMCTFGVLGLSCETPAASRLVLEFRMNERSDK